MGERTTDREVFFIFLRWSHQLLGAPLDTHCLAMAMLLFVPGDCCLYILSGDIINIVGHFDFFFLPIFKSSESRYSSSDLVTNVASKKK